MSHRAVVEAYGARAVEYSEHLGSVDAMHRDDRRHIESWAAQVQGTILDIGCGPGHWTAHPVGLGCAARGIDPITGFVPIAQAPHDDVKYSVGTFHEHGAGAKSLGGWHGTRSSISIPSRCRLRWAPCTLRCGLVGDCWSASSRVSRITPSIIRSRRRGSGRSR